MNGNRIGSLLLGSFVLAGLSGANTGTPWSNPLLKGVPADALGFVSIDLGGTQQPLSTVMNLLGAAGGQGGGLEQLAASGMQMLHLPDDLGKACAKYGSKRIVAFMEGQPGMGVLFGLKPGHGMKAALTGGTAGTQDGIAYQKFGDKFVTLDGNTLILSDTTHALVAASHALHGGPAYSTAKVAHLTSNIETDAEIVGVMDGGSSHISVGKGIDLKMAASIGLHHGGISLCIGPVKTPAMPGVPDFSSFTPLPYNYLSTLPGGAYFLVGLAPLGPIINQQKGLGDMPGAPALVRQALRSVFGGDMILGLYPTTLKGGKPDGLDLLAEIRPRRGPNPGLAIINGLKQQMVSMLPGKKGSLFEAFTVNGADHAYRLSPKVLSFAKIAMKGMAKQSGLPLDSLVKAKTLEFAMIGRSVIVATSDPVLRKAVTAYKYGKSALVFDPKFQELARDASKPTQFVLAVSLSRIVQFGTGLFQNIMANGGLGKAGLPENIPVGMVAGMLGQWPDPLMVRFGVTSDGIAARVFVPIDFNMLSMIAGSIPKGNR